MTIDALSSALPSTSSGSTAGRTVARVDLGASHRGEGCADAALLDLALQRIGRTVRSGDRICPYGVSNVAVAFGPDAEAVTARTLGERLARAISLGSTSGRPVDAGAVVVVDRILHQPPLPSDDHPGPTVARPTGQPVLKQRVSAPRLRHRTVVRYPAGRLSGYGNRHDDLAPRKDKASSGTILVVDPSSPAGGPGLAAVTACSLAAQQGFRAEAISDTDHEDLVLDIEGTQIDLAVVVVGKDPVSDHITWPTSSWCRPAQVAKQYLAAGVDVLAVGSGSSAGALAGCVRLGASALYDLEELPSALQALQGIGSRPGEVRSRPIQPELEALMQFSASERRVLFFLTQGRSAQEIADQLVVSLTTVRSHIRSVLRKLRVKSQLAAVAVANSQGLPLIPEADDNLAG
jgi:DNA-binding CsgD family transcriptional regulator